MKCYYHKSDLDGHCAGAIVLSKYPTCEMIGVDYNDHINFEHIIPDEEIYIVDFRFDMHDMNKLNDLCKVHWIDHHKTSIDEAYGHKFLASGGQNLEIGKAGCELTWEYLFSVIPMPMTVKLLGRYDVWDHENEDVLPFQYGMRQSENTLPQHGIWIKLFQNNNISRKLIESILENGKLILNYENKQNTMYASGMSYEAEFEGLRAIVMNKAYANSKAFDSVYDPEKHDIMVLFGVKPYQLKYTLFCDKPNIDVSQIAKKYGGGGHKGAAGFHSKYLLV